MILVYLRIDDGICNHWVKVMSAKFNYYKVIILSSIIICFQMLWDYIISCLLRRLPSPDLHPFMIFSLSHSFFINWHSTVRKSFSFSLIYLFTYLFLLIITFLIWWIIIHYSPVIPALSSRSPFKLALASFWHVPMVLWEFPYFKTTKSSRLILSLTRSCTGASHFSKEPWFLLVSF